MVCKPQKKARCNATILAEEDVVPASTLRSRRQRLREQGVDADTVNRKRKPGPQPSTVVSDSALRKRRQRLRREAAAKGIDPERLLPSKQKRRPVKQEENMPSVFDWITGAGKQPSEQDPNAILLKNLEEQVLQCKARMEIDKTESQRSLVDSEAALSRARAEEQRTKNIGETLKLLQKSCTPKKKRAVSDVVEDDEDEGPTVIEESTPRKTSEKTPRKASTRKTPSKSTTKKKKVAYSFDFEDADEEALLDYLTADCIGSLPGNEFDMAVRACYSGGLFKKATSKRTRKYNKLGADELHAFCERMNKVYPNVELNYDELAPEQVAQLIIDCLERKL